MTGPLHLAAILVPLGFLTVAAILIGAFLVFRVERGWDTTLMFTGALLSFIMQVVHLLPVPGIFRVTAPVTTPGESAIVASNLMGDLTPYPWYIGSVMTLGMFGGLLFATGFVAYALRKRTKQNAA